MATATASRMYEVFSADALGDFQNGKFIFENRGASLKVEGHIERVTHTASGILIELEHATVHEKGSVKSRDGGRDELRWPVYEESCEVTEIAQGARIVWKSDKGISARVLKHR